MCLVNCKHMTLYICCLVWRVMSGKLSFVRTKKIFIIKWFPCSYLPGEALIGFSPLCIPVIPFLEGVHPGVSDPKELWNVFVFFPPPLNLAISLFLEVPVPLTHSGSPSQSPFVNRTMFYNSPALWDDHINNAEEPYLSGAMRLFLRFGPTVMVIVWQTIYSSNNDHRLQRFSD
jgi:hypothetical protein